jgi:hypothetical protein
MISRLMPVREPVEPPKPEVEERETRRQQEPELTRIELTRIDGSNRGYYERADSGATPEGSR